ncbi:hypothetical protein Tco_0589183 [Tanacetum coccineum]
MPTEMELNTGDKPNKELVMKSRQKPGQYIMLQKHQAIVGIEDSHGPSDAIWAHPSQLLKVQKTIVFKTHRDKLISIDTAHSELVDNE